MTPARSALSWAAVALALAGLTLLYAGALRTRLLNDDYVFLEQARTHALPRALVDSGTLGGYYRPLSRQLYFGLLAPLARDRASAYHAVNYALYLGALALLADLLLALLPPAGALAGVVYFALLPLQRVVLTWISCCQDLLALAAVLATLALYRRGRRGLALLACAAALASKEAALPVIAALAAWDLILERRGVADTARRTWPFAALALVWIGAVLAIRGTHLAPALRFDVAAFAAAYAHLAQSLVGFEAPSGLLAALLRRGPALLPLLALAPLAVVVGRLAAPADEPARRGPERDTGDRALRAFAAVWLLAFGAAVGPVVQAWSGYFYVLAAVGGAILVGSLMRRARTLGLLGLLVAVMWVHAGAAAQPGFAVAQNPWTATSHVTARSLQRGATLTDSMSVQLRRLEPSPPTDARLFFATLPPAAGFQMGNGALLRSVYRRSDLESHFLSQFSAATAGDYPCRFYYWDGAEIAPLYPSATDTFFQVGCDLLLLDRVEGALHAFRRGTAASEDSMDLLYWTGWAELWAGDRDAAEQAWTRLGFRDDSLRWIAHLRAAHNKVTDGDTLEARRHLITGIEYGVGRPQAHAVLGELLLQDRKLKYGLLELKVALWLEPRDWVARTDLAAGLVAVRLDDAARRELDTLVRQRPELTKSPRVLQLRQQLERRSRAMGEVAEF